MYVPLLCLLTARLGVNEGVIDTDNDRKLGTYLLENHLPTHG